MLLMRAIGTRLVKWLVNVGLLRTEILLYVILASLYICVIIVCVLLYRRYLGPLTSAMWAGLSTRCIFFGVGFRLFRLLLSVVGLCIELFWRGIRIGLIGIDRIWRI